MSKLLLLLLFNPEERPVNLRKSSVYRSISKQLSPARDFPRIFLWRGGSCHASKKSEIREGGGEERLSGLKMCIIGSSDFSKVGHVFFPKRIFEPSRKNNLMTVKGKASCDCDTQIVFFPASHVLMSRPTFKVMMSVCTPK